MSVLEKTLGSNDWEELQNTDFFDISYIISLDGNSKSCSSWLALSGEDLVSHANITFLVCVLIAGSFYYSSWYHIMLII